MQRFVHYTLALAAGAVSFVSQAHASLLVDNTAATDITVQYGAAADDASSGSRGIGFSFPFYGVNKVSIYGNNNGRFNFLGSDTAFSNVAATTSSSTTIGGWIAPFWDDLAFQTGAPASQALEQKSFTGIYAQTLSNDRIRVSSNAPTAQRVTFQVALFGTDQTYNGFNFLTGDIALSYANLISPPTTGDFTIGVNKGTSTAVGASIPGDADGLLNYASQTGLVPTGDGQFILFRYNATTGNYVSSIQTVPEPATLAALASVALGFRRLRRA